MVLVTFDGNELGRGPLSRWYTNNPDRGVDVGLRSGGRPVVGPDAESMGVGCTPNGRAVVGLWPGACGSGAHKPGTYLVDPASGVRRRIHGLYQGAPLTGFWAGRENRLERVMGRAHRELGLGDCCFQPSHGGGDAEDGFVFEGHIVPVHAVPLDELRYRGPIRPGELSFTCGDARYFLVDAGPSGQTHLSSAPDRRLLERAADRLAPGLYCTRGPTEYSAPE